MTDDHLSHGRNQLTGGLGGMMSRLGEVRHLGWDVGIRFMERLAGHRRGDMLDFNLRATARDILAEKSRAVREEMDALTQTMMRAGSYARAEDASRAVDAVLDALRDRVPPDLLLRLSDYLSEGEAARLRAGLRQRLQREEGFPFLEKERPA